MNWAHDENLRGQVIQFIGWALVHTTYQGAVIAVVAALAMRYLLGAARARYLCGVAGLVLMVALPALTSWQLLPRGDAPAAHTFDVGATAPARSATRPKVVLAAGWTKPVDAGSGGEAPPPPEVFDPKEPEHRGGWLTWVVAGWIVGASACVVHLALGLLGVMRLRWTGVVPLAEEWHERVERLARRMRLRRTPRVLASLRARVPLVMGWLRPCIVLPVSLLTEMTPAQVELVLLHEMAHIRRLDLWVNLLQALIESALFFHPAVWWLSRRVRLERELCCDEMVVELSQAGVEYAQALWSIAAANQLPDSPGTQAALAATGGGGVGALRLRIEHILAEREAGRRARPWTRVMLVLRRRPVGHWIGISAALAALLGGLWLMCAPAVAQWYLGWRLAQVLVDPQPAREHAIVMNWRPAWQGVDWGSRHTYAAAFEVKGLNLVLSVVGRGMNHVWVRDLREPIDLQRYPIVVMRYRVSFTAGNLDPRGYVVWGQDGPSPMGGVTLVRLDELIADGESHVLVKDFRRHKPRGPLTRLALEGHGLNDGVTDLVIEDLRFAAAESEGNTAPKEEEGTRRMIRVTDAAGAPQANVTVRTHADRRNWMEFYRTDAAGQVAVPLNGSGPHWLLVEGDDTAVTEVGPLTNEEGAEPVTVVLEPATVLGGVVMSREGSIAGATVEVNMAGASARAGQWERRSAQMLTNAKGEWQTPALAVRGEALRVAVGHAQFVPYLAATRLGAQPAAAAAHGEPVLSINEGPTVEQYVRGQARFVLELGITVNGRLHIPEQAEVGEVSVALETREGTALCARVPVAAGGGFTLPPAPDGDAYLAVYAQDSCWARLVHVQADMGELKINLEDVKQPDVELRVAGEVTDGETGEVIPKFTITRAHMHRLDAHGGIGEVHWEGRTATPGEAGEFATVCVRSGLPTLIKVEAAGYQPVISRPFLKHEGAQVWKVAMSRQ